MNLPEGAALFAGMAFAYEKNIHDALDGACLIIEKEAQRVIGTYEYGWPPLSPATIARKATGDSPLRETGACILISRPVSFLNASTSP